MSAKGYKSDPKTTKPIKALQYTCLKTVSDVRKLLGLLGYFRHYIQDFSRTASLLYDLLKFGETSESLQLHSKNKRKSTLNTNQLPSSHKVEWKKIHQNVLESLRDNSTQYIDYVKILNILLDFLPFILLILVGVELPLCIVVTLS